VAHAVNLDSKIEASSTILPADVRMSRKLCDSLDLEVSCAVPAFAVMLYGIPDLEKTHRFSGYRVRYFFPCRGSVCQLDGGRDRS